MPGGRNGAASAAELAKKLGITEADAENIMEFWAAEGVVLELDDDEKRKRDKQTALEIIEKWM